MKTTRAIFGVLKMTVRLTGRIGTSSVGPLLLLLGMVPVLSAHSAVVFTTLHSFQAFTNGPDPAAALVQGSDGYFYGTTSSGGFSSDSMNSGPGTVFKSSTNGVLTCLYSFTGGRDGEQPIAGLVEGSDGYFYGTTCFGGAYASPNGQGGYGTVFRISTNGALTTLHFFSGTNDGGWPQSALVQGSDGSYCGTTSGGGKYTDQYGVGCGTVFKMTTNGAVTCLYSFTGGYDGGAPNGLVQGSDGYFYGTTSWGGTNDASAGTVFKISTSGALTTLYWFTGGDDGGGPRSGLVQGSDGYFYGTTSGMDNHPSGCGTVFKISTSGALTTLYSFTDGNDGAFPQAGLVQGSDGYFYGTTLWGGGDQGYGTVFRISTNGALTTLHSFTGGDDGAGPAAALVQGSDGYFYGTTEYNHFIKGDVGIGAGTIFRLTIVPEPQLTIIHSEPYVILSWPIAYAGFSYGGYTLQSATNVGSSAVWTPVSPKPVIIGGQNLVINTISGTQRFFRLSE